mmetsp:Transcript_5519/g.13306  ORF Transcript_5519/g.13306 Transcript_5519/m.13306 type:complete len:1095 (-) Transcript_5519:4456-7740(-)
MGSPSGRCIAAQALAARLQFHAPQHRQPQRRHHHEQEDRPDEHATDHHDGQRALHLAADAMADGGGQQADAGGQRGHQQGAHPVQIGVVDRLLGRAAAKPLLLEIGQDQDAVHHRDAQQRHEADHRGNADHLTRHEQREHATGHGEGHGRQRQQAVADAVEQGIEQRQDQHQGCRDQHAHARLGLLQLLELAGVHDPVAVGQGQVLRQRGLDLRDGAAKVAAAHTELDRDVALVALVIDVGRAGVQADGGDFAQRHIARATAGVVAHPQVADALDAGTGGAREAHRQAVLPLAFQHRSNNRAAQRGLHNGIDIAGVQAIAGRLDAVDLDAEVGLAEDIEDAEVTDALDLPHQRHRPGGNLFEDAEIGPDDLDRVGTLDAREPLFDVVLDVLREVEDHARELARQQPLQLVHELLLGQAGWPFVQRLERREQLNVVEARGIAAVVGPAVLRHHGQHLGEALDDLAHPVGHLGAGLERDGGRHGRPDPQIALLERRQKLAAELAGQHDDADQEGRREAAHPADMGEGPAQHGFVDALDPAHQPGFLLGHPARQQIGHQHRRHREGGQQGAGQRIAIGAGHGAKDLALDPRHQEQRGEGRNGDEGREQDGVVHLQRAHEDHAQALGPAQRRVGVPAMRSARHRTQGLHPLPWWRLEVAVDVLDQDDRRVDDDAEVHRAQRQQIGGFPTQHQHDDAEAQCERDVDADDDRAAQVAQEDPLDEENQHASEHQVVDHGVCGDIDQRRAVVIGLQAHALRQAAVAVHRVDRRLDAGNDVLGLQRAVHHHHAGDDIVAGITAGLAKPGHMTNADLGHVAHQHRLTVLLAEHGVAEILDVAHQAEAAHIDGLIAHADRAPTHVVVRIAQGLDDLLQRQAVALQPARLDLDVVLLGRAAPGHDLADTGHRQQAPLDDPVLDAAQVGQAVGTRALDLVAQDLAHQAGGLDLWLHAIGQVDVLLQADRGLGQRRDVVDAVLEGHTDEGQAVERGRADVVHPERGGQADFHRTRVVALHLLGRLPGRLRGDLQDDRRRVGIGLDIELIKGQQPCRQKSQQPQQDQRAARQHEGQQRTKHLGAPFSSVPSAPDCSGTAPAPSRSSPPA